MKDDNPDLRRAPTSTPTTEGGFFYSPPPLPYATSTTTTFRRHVATAVPYTTTPDPTTHGRLDGRDWLTITALALVALGAFTLAARRPKDRTMT